MLRGTAACHATRRRPRDSTCGRHFNRACRARHAADHRRHFLSLFGAPALRSFIARRGGGAAFAASRIRGSIVSPAGANVCAALRRFHPVQSGTPAAFRRLHMHAIQDRKLTKELINVLELMVAAKCRGKTFVCFSQSFAR
ncbi:uncharacterized protein BCN122_I1416 [Burkholderia cenocepacia]|nr:uncharacterized protein BCN122_I1416 [Burkholderia cenocepacia]